MNIMVMSEVKIYLVQSELILGLVVRQPDFVECEQQRHIQYNGTSKWQYQFIICNLIHLLTFKFFSPTLLILLFRISNIYISFSILFSDCSSTSFLNYILHTIGLHYILQ